MSTPRVFFVYKHPWRLVTGALSFLSEINNSTEIKDKNEKTQTEVFINVSSGINPFLLLISNTVIKIIHTIDEKENLREQRKEKINGES